MTAETTPGVDSSGVDATEAVISDEDLVLLTRAGDRSAFAELWHRHSRSGIKVARGFTSSIDSEDLVSEAYARIYQLVMAGGGPTGAFRPYLYTTIRNLASRWGKSRRDVNVDDIGDFENPDVADDPATSALDRTLTVRAFRSLPDRWQSVLWYTEVEGMDPHEVAPMLGISANSVAALSYRAREGLRKAWLQAHITNATASGECQWALTRMGDYTRNGLSARERVRVSDHLATCTKCCIISEEVDEVGSRLALVMIPLLLGGTVGGLLLSSLSAPGSAMAATASVAPAVPPAFGVLGSAGATAAAAPAIASGLTVGALTAPLVGTLALAIVVSGGLAVSSQTIDPAPVSVAQSAGVTAAGLSLPLGVDTSQDNFLTGHGASVDGVRSTASGLLGGTGTALDGVLGAVGSTADGLLGGQLGATVNGVTSGLGTTLNGVTTGVGGTVNGVVNSLADPTNGIIPSVTTTPNSVTVATPPVVPVPVAVVANLVLTGTGMPGAVLSIQSGASVLATTTVTASGTWAVTIANLPTSVTSVQAKQVLVSILGIDLVVVPVHVLTNNLGISVGILGL